MTSAELSDRLDIGAELAAIRVELRQIHSKQASLGLQLQTILEHLARRPSVDGLDAAILKALDTAMGDYDLAFSSSEVRAHGESDHALGEALRARGLTDVAAIGARFRELQDRDIDGFRLVRDGRLWRLQRT